MQTVPQNPFCSQIFYQSQSALVFYPPNGFCKLPLIVVLQPCTDTSKLEAGQAAVAPSITAPPSENVSKVSSYKTTSSSLATIPENLLNDYKTPPEPSKFAHSPKSPRIQSPATIPESMLGYYTPPPTKPKASSSRTPASISDSRRVDISSIRISPGSPFSATRPSPNNSYIQHGLSPGQKTSLSPQNTSYGGNGDEQGELLNTLLNLYEQTKDNLQDCLTKTKNLQEHIKSLRERGEEVPSHLSEACNNFSRMAVALLEQAESISERMNKELNESQGNCPCSTNSSESTNESGELSRITYFQEVFYQLIKDAYQYLTRAAQLQNIIRSGGEEVPPDLIQECDTFATIAVNMACQAEMILQQMTSHLESSFGTSNSSGNSSFGDFTLTSPPASFISAIQTVPASSPKTPPQNMPEERVEELNTLYNVYEQTKENLQDCLTKAKKLQEYINLSRQNEEEVSSDLVETYNTYTRMAVQLIEQAESLSQQMNNLLNDKNQDSLASTLDSRRVYADSDPLTPGSPLSATSQSRCTCRSTSIQENLDSSGESSIDSMLELYHELMKNAYMCLTKAAQLQNACRCAAEQGTEVSPDIEEGRVNFPAMALNYAQQAEIVLQQMTSRLEASSSSGDSSFNESSLIQFPLSSSPTVPRTETENENYVEVVNTLYNLYEQSKNNFRECLTRATMLQEYIKALTEQGEEVSPIFLEMYNTFTAMSVMLIHQAEAIMLQIENILNESQGNCPCRTINIQESLDGNNSSRINLLQELYYELMRIAYQYLTQAAQMQKVIESAREEVSLDLIEERDTYAAVALNYAQQAKIILQQMSSRLENTFGSLTSSLLERSFGDFSLDSTLGSYGEEFRNVSSSTPKASKNNNSGNEYVERINYLYVLYEQSKNNFHECLEKATNLQEEINLFRERGEEISPNLVETYNAFTRIAVQFLEQAESITRRMDNLLDETHERTSPQADTQDTVNESRNEYLVRVNYLYDLYYESMKNAYECLTQAARFQAIITCATEEGRDVSPDVIEERDTFSALALQFSEQAENIVQKMFTRMEQNALASNFL